MSVQRMLLTVFGLGWSRIAPGTVGSMPPVLLALLLVWLWLPAWMIEVVLVLCGLAFAVACVRFTPGEEAASGDRDPSYIVADEVAGQVLPLLFLPWQLPLDRASLAWNLCLAVSAFVAFRVFDITKPPPIRSAEKLPGGWGVLVDDLIAGLYALFVVQLIARLALPALF